MNNVVLLGRLTKDVDLKFTAGNGMAVARFTVAVNRMKKGEADFINCVAFGKTAETISQYIFKGNQIALQGHIQTGSYEKDGKRVFTTDVIVDRFNFVDSAKKESNVQENDWTPMGDGDAPF